VMFPGLRLGYLVVPKDLLPSVIATRALTDRHPPGPIQAVLSEFMVAGHFERHIRRTRECYRAKRQVLMEHIPRLFGQRLQLLHSDTGMHLVGWLPVGEDDQVIAAKAVAVGLETLPVSAYALSEQHRGGLVLGYSAFSEAELLGALEVLAGCLSK
jgi:GntR family transcriptional regulator / MocR family aminotransferase